MKNSSLATEARGELGDKSASTKLQTWCAICFLLIGALGALPLVILTPPLQAPDEPQHFYRAYQLSEGRVFSEVRNGEVGALLPSSLLAFTERMLGTRALHADRPVVNRPFREVVDQIRVPLEPDRREFADFRGAALYSPLPYLPQALAVAVVRMAGASPLGMLWAGRTANAICALLVLALAIWLMPVGAGVTTFAALLPMSLFLYASMSPDALVIACAFLFTGLALRGTARGSWTGIEAAMAGLAGLVFCSVKPTYAPLLALPVALLFHRGKPAHVLVVQATILAVALGGTMVWLSFAQSILLPPFPHTDPSAQTRFVFDHPFKLIVIILNSISNNALFYYFSFVGVLGWLTIYLPLFAYILTIVGFIGGIFVVRNNQFSLTLGAVVWSLLIMLFCVILVFLALYIYWSPVGHWQVAGVQGRYFLPLVALFGAIIASVLSPTGWRRGVTVARISFVTVLMVLAATTQYIVANAYGFFSNIDKIH